jgi:hypothetical protein
MALDEGDDMKCIHCGRISRLRERPDGRCPGCGHSFAFDPDARPGAGTDAEFQAAIDRVSGGGRLRFTARQLWLAANAPLRRPAPPGGGEWIILYAVVGAVPGILMAFLEPGFVILAMVGGAATGAIGWGVAQDEMNRYTDQLRPRGPFQTFLRYQLSPWLEVHGDIPGLLPQHDTDAAAAPPPVPADAAAFDCLLVTDRRETAQMLLANGFHLEHDCVVLSRGGYPYGSSADTVRAVLRRKPRLTVFALHDASPEGCRLPLYLRRPEWFPDPSVRIVDLGLRPRTVMRLTLPYFPGPRLQSGPEVLNGLLPDADVGWLFAGNVFELAAVPSAEVMRAAYEGMVAAGRNDGSGRAPVYNDVCWTYVGAWFGSLAHGIGADTDTAADVAAVAMSR